MLFLTVVICVTDVRPRNDRYQAKWNRIVKGAKWVILTYVSRFKPISGLKRTVESRVVVEQYGSDKSIIAHQGTAWQYHSYNYILLHCPVSIAYHS